MAIPSWMPATSCAFEQANAFWWWEISGATEFHIAAGDWISTEGIFTSEEESCMFVDAPPASPGAWSKYYPHRIFRHQNSPAWGNFVPSNYAKPSIVQDEWIKYKEKERPKKKLVMNPLFSKPLPLP